MNNIKLVDIDPAKHIVVERHVYAGLLEAAKHLSMCTPIDLRFKCRECIGSEKAIAEAEGKS